MRREEAADNPGLRHSRREEAVSIALIDPDATKDVFQHGRYRFRVYAGVKEFLARPGGARRPRILLIDPFAPGIGGIAALRLLIGCAPDLPVLVWSGVREPEQIFSALTSGARGYLLKGEPEEAILRGIETCLAESAAFSPEIARLVLSFFRRSATGDLPSAIGKRMELLELLFDAGSRGR